MPGHFNQPMIKIWQGYVGLLCLLPWLALAQIQSSNEHEASPWAPNTGDTWVDKQLIDINHYAQRYPEAFVDELVRYGNVQRETVQALLNRNWRPGDIWFACFWAQVVDINCHQILQLRHHQQQLDWLAIIQQLPIAPENLHYRALRHALVASFDHWERPIVLDARLQQQLGTRAQRNEHARQRHKTQN